MHVGQLIKLLRQHQPDLALIHTTFCNTLELEQQVRARGVTYYLIKPLNMDELSSVIRHTALKKHGSPKENHHEETHTCFLS
jgi:response regulator RpfG family c-di-GMP phosphodiesterase